MIAVKERSPTMVCDECEKAKKIPSLLSAIKKHYATESTRKFISSVFMAGNRELVTSFFDSKLLSSCSLEHASRTDYKDYFSLLAVNAKAGLFKDKSVALGLIEAIATKAERTAAGHSTTGVKLRAELDHWLTAAGAQSPAVLRLFNNNFAGRSLRSQREVRRKNGGQLLPELCLENFKSAAKWLDGVNYTGPVAGASDQTVCLENLRHHNGHLVGAEGGDIRIENGSDMEGMVKDIYERKALCNKASSSMPAFLTMLNANQEENPFDS